jgi:hypothetical protein
MTSVQAGLVVGVAFLFAYATITFCWAALLAEQAAPTIALWFAAALAAGLGAGVVDLMLQ